MSADHQNQPAPSNTTQIAALVFPVLLGIYLLITSTTHLSDSLWQFDAKRMLQLYLLPALFLWVLLIPALRAAFILQAARIPRWMAIALTLMFTLGVISAWYNSESNMGLAYSLADVALLFLLIVAALAIAACRSLSSEWFDRIVIVLVAMVGVTVGLQELIGVVAALSQGLEFHPRIALQYFSWPRFYNQVQAWSMPVIAALPLLFPGRPLAKLLCIAALALHWYVVIATGARGTTVGVVFAIIAGCMLFPAMRRSMILYQAGGLIAAILIYAAVVLGHQSLTSDAVPEKSADSAPQQAASVAEAGETQEEQKARSIALQKIGDSSGEFLEPVTGERMLTSSGRTALWRESWHDTETHPWLGIGPMNYACKGPTLRAAHPHSFPLQFLGEWGIPAFLLLVLAGGFMVIALWRALRSPANTSDKRNIAAYLATGVLAAAILSLLDGVLIMPASQVTGILICGWLLGSLAVSPPVVGTVVGSRPLFPGLLAKVLLAVALIVSLVFLWFAQTEINQHEQALEQTHMMDRLIPRLWQNGKVCQLYQLPEAG